MKQPNELNDQELQNEYKSLHRSINVYDCFKANEVLRMEFIGRELNRRGYKIVPDVRFEKEDCDDCNDCNDCDD